MNTIEMRNLELFLFIAFGVVVIAAKEKKNVLFLATDDMRPQLGAYSGADFPDPAHPVMYTPNLDALAAKSLLLKRAYVQQAVCSPSRASLLTGRRPDTTHVYDLITYWRNVGGNFTTIPQYFKEHGYRTIGMGKIFHPGHQASGDDDIKYSWTDTYFHADRKHWVTHNSTWVDVSPEEEKKYPLPDKQITAHAIKTLRAVADSAKNGDQPFFVAVGFHKPHLPWAVPHEFYELYPLDEIKLPPNPYAPVGMPEIAWSNFDEIRKFDDYKLEYGYGSINTTLPDIVTKQWRRAYYAAISYVDSLVGKVLKELDDLGLSNNTIVSFFGDHGWQLGEHGEWCKHTNFELPTHAPMMISVPGLTHDGIKAEQLTEFVDLFPTLAEAAGLPKIPLCPKENSSKVETCSEGVSLVPLMKDPERPWKSAVFSQYPRMGMSGDTIMGYSMRTDRYRYTEWVPFHQGPAFQPNLNRIYHNTSAELYDHKEDPYENHNRAFDPNFASIRAQLHEKLHKGWRHAMPRSYLQFVM